MFDLSKTLLCAQSLSNKNFACFSSYDSKIEKIEISRIAQNYLKFSHNVIKKVKCNF